ncbi:hypothetical protein TPSD3_08605 [Thioflexithrix psekupsensis]|uniref:Lcl C-terminal domain-containing protein n=1 Tax=Thioflexithrix psekupsensis TaxID=1570016 RepID=A0A251X9D4_9GAMM|nr:hypothetical protein TPSD3_08605 [Thioflexithrix psekupsensis]
MGVLLSFNVWALQMCNNAIRASTPNDRFQINEDGTVTDVRTNLVWKRCLEGQTGANCETGNASRFTWQQALQYAKQVGEGWRLPNIKELASIVELKCDDPAINLSAFPNTRSSGVWSSSPVASGTYNAWDVNFGNGGANYYNRYYDNNHVRLVRGGQ